MKRIFVAALCVVLALLAFDPLLALAQAVVAPVTDATTAPVVVVQDPVVTIPYGQWIVALQELATPLLLAVLAFLMRSLPEAIVSIIRTAKVDQLLIKGIQAAINQVAGAAKDKKMSVPIANEVIRKVVQYAVNEGPAWLITWMGGPEGIKAKVIARIQLVDGAAIDPAAINVSDIKPEHA